MWAYAYEFRDDPIVSDSKFDETCKLIDLSIDTGNEQMDKWFRENFNPSTGIWIHDHPGISKIKQIYDNRP